LNKEAIRTKGKKAMGVFLQHLQVYKSTADNKRGIAFFNKYLEVLFFSKLGKLTTFKVQRNHNVEQKAKETYCTVRR
jgi:hypothetical protein